MEFWGFQIVKFIKCAIFMEFSELEIIQNSKIANFWNFRNWKFLEFLKLKSLEIIQVENSWNFANKKFLKFFKLEILGGISQIRNS